MNIFITGGTSGIGKCLARLYLTEGQRVGVCGGDLKFFEESYKDETLKPLFFELDVRDREKHQQVLNDFSNGTLDIFIACAGINQQGNNGPVLDFDLAHRLMDINLKGTMNGIEAAFNLMRPKKFGHIAVLSSASAVAGFPGAAAYTASKAAIMTMMEALAIDYRHFGIYCHCLCPGYVDTPLAHAAKREKLPMLISGDSAAKAIKTAIERKKVLYFFPLLVSVSMLFIRIMPRWLFRWMEWHFNRKKIMASVID